MTSPRLRHLWVSAAVCLCTASALAIPLSRAPTSSAAVAGDKSYRLPGDTKPVHYDVHITPTIGPADFSFTGTVRILFKVIKATNKLTLHADRLQNIKCTLDDDTQPLAAPVADEKRQFITFDLKRTVAVGGQHQLSCTYAGTIGDDDKGFYRSSYYDDAADVTRWFGITQFEMTFARRALPCYDEPNARATFLLTITHSKDLQAVSNTRPCTVERSGDLVTTAFEPTPSMPVYTLAWMVSDLPSRANDARDFRSFAQPSQLQRTTTSQAVGPRVLSLMAQYTGIAYQVDKMDQVAVPDHNFGAMENWGLVTYRQALLLADGWSRADTVLSVNTVIAHELVHQWFGNLVTPNWWCHVWLSEAFAEYFSYVMTDKINPAWKVMDKMPLLEMHDAFIPDALASTHAMNNEVFTPEEILSNFGPITYAKGASVLRMMEDAITDVAGSDRFQRGLQNYLNDRKASGVAMAHDVWANLDKVADKSYILSASYADMFGGWVTTPGFPLVSVARKGGTATLSQARFFSSGPNPEDATLWQIPIRWRLEGIDFTLAYRLDNKSQELDLMHGDSKWVLINADQVGYFRVQYDDDNWRALTAALLEDVDALTVSERAMLLDDALVLARAGMLSYDVALGLAEYLRQEKAYAPWAAFQNNIEYVAMQLRAGSDEDATLFNTWVQGLEHKIFNNLAMTPSTTDTFEDRLTRGVVARLAYEAQDPSAIIEADLKFETWQVDGDRSVDPDSLRVIMCSGVKDDGVFVDLVTRLADSEDEARRSDLTYALGCAADDSLKSELIRVIIYDSKGLKDKDVKALWKSLVSTDAGLTVTLRYLTEHGDELINDPLVGPARLGEMFTTIAPRIASQANFDKLNAFFNSHSVVSGLADALTEAVAAAKANLDWKKAHYDSIVSYIKKPRPTPAPTTPTEPTSTEPTSTEPTSTEPTSTEPTSTEPTSTEPTSTEPTPTGSTPTGPTPTGPTVTTPAPPTPSPSPYRLPQTVSPSLYVLILTVDDGASSFSGILGVSVEAGGEGVQAITLHASSLEFGAENVTLTPDDNGEAIAATGVAFDSDLEQATISLASAMTPGSSYTLAINYTGSLRDDLTGLYRAPLGAGNMIATQMYPAYARRVLPCWDEPRYRAPMQVSVLHSKTYTAVSSAPLIDQEDVLPRSSEDDDTTLDVFEPTGPIPASQLALYLLDASQAATDHHTGNLTTLYALPDVVARAKSAGLLSQTDALLNWFAAQAGSDAGLEQLSLVGVTSSLGPANDAWGLVALRDRNLVDMDNSPSSGESEQTWLLQLSRHLAQLWFGDLVGVEWWSDAWLREGFATFYEYAAAETVAAHWQLRGQLYTRAVAPALHADSFEGAHPLNDDGVSGSQESIANHLDVITSGKGAAVVQMLKHALQENGTFATGLQEYVKECKNSIGKPADLYKAMQSAVTALQAPALLPDGVTVADVLASWVDRSGYPVVNAIRNYDNKTATLSQERFLLHTASSSSGAAGGWWLPVSYALHDEYMSVHDNPVKAWLPPGQELEIRLDAAADGSDVTKEFLLVNADRKDFFRVNYDVHNWMLLRRYMDEYHTLVNTEARAALVDDALALARTGRLDYAVALEVVDFLRVDYDLAPWEAARAGFDYLDAQLLGSRHEAVYKTWLLQLLDTVFQQSNYFPEELDTHVQRLARAVSTAWACELGHKYCVQYATMDFSEWLDESDSVGHDTLAATACVGLRGENAADDLPVVLTKLRVQQDDALRAAIIQGLGCAAGDNAKLTWDAKSGLRRGEATLVWKAASRFGPSSVDASLDLLADNIDAVIRVSGKAAAESVIEILANRVTTQSQYDKLSSLASRFDATRLQGALRLAEDNIEWQSAYLEVVAEKLYELTNTPDPDLPTTPTTPPPTPPTDVTFTDPPERSSTSAATFWTLPTTAGTTAVTLPTLPTLPSRPPSTPPSVPPPTDPATAATKTTGTWFTLPPTRPVTAESLPPLTSTPSTSTPSTSNPSTSVKPPPPTRAPNGAAGLASSAGLVVVSVLALRGTWP
ncbi:hypothetical protein ONE63_005280 [Megalurothrips usitatus]|uniref:Aminopeptidase N-like n=1 Tax=Megalurothrips usitatus TaxID=439358 RepID=A0AAV7XY51_9NEOP|nr:hypothetical protein ONE63_005280 [Megalurothrips usitatus]